MSKGRTPKLRTVDKVVAPYPLNIFPSDFPYKLAQELVYLLATKGQPDLEGSEWEAIFARCIDAEWKPSNVGLDDVVLSNTAWSAKSVKATHPSRQNTVRLISGRNSPVYSYSETIDVNADPNLVGKGVVDIWNERVSAVRERHKHLRTVVLIKSSDLTEVVVYEFDTVRYDTDRYSWLWNKNHNLCGFDKTTDRHIFTWQPHGSQFTIHETVPPNSLIVQIRPPEPLDKTKVLEALGFDRSWVTVRNLRG